MTTFIVGLALGFIWAFSLITVMAQNPVTKYSVPWVQAQVDQQGRPAKGRLTISEYLKKWRI